MAPLVLTWWLPWGRWIPWGRLPKALLGPYVLYVSLAAQHFGVGKWFVLGLFVVGTVVSIAAIVEQIKQWN